MSMPEKSTQKTLDTNLSTWMPQQSTQKNFQTLTYSVQDSLAKLFRWLENGSDLKTQEALYFMKLLGLQSKNDLDICYLKTLQDFYLTITGERLQKFSQRWMKSGTMQNGKCSIANISFHKTGNVSNIIGYLRGTSRPEVFPIRESNKIIDTVEPATDGRGEGMADGLAHTIDSNYWKGGRAGRTMIVSNVRTLEANKKRADLLRTTGSEKGSDRTVENRQLMIRDEQIAKCITPIMNSDNLIVEPELKQIGNIDQRGHNSMWGRIYDPEGISSTLGAEGGGLGAKTGLYKFGGKIRKLTPLECERLQGFPDNYTEGISDTQRYRCVGNAVTVPLVEFLVSKLK